VTDDRDIIWKNLYRPAGHFLLVEIFATFQVFEPGIYKRL